MENIGPGEEKNEDISKIFATLKNALGESIQILANNTVTDDEDNLAFSGSEKDKERIKKIWLQF